MSWSRNDVVESRIGFTLWLADRTGRANLRFTRSRTGDDVDEQVDLTATALHWGGLRWWFTCPLARDGRPCGRRVAKLYLPPGKRYFGCRRCHLLTYESCREAHKFDAMFAQLGASLGMTGRSVAKQLKSDQRQAARVRWGPAAGG